MTDAIHDYGGPDERITLGELSRTCQEIKQALAEMRDEAKMDRHELRNAIHEVGVAAAVLETRVDVLETRIGESRNWLSGLISGSIVALVAWLMNHFRP